MIAVLEEGLKRRAVIEALPMQPGDVPQTFADVSKARRLLNYDPRTEIGDGIARFLDWFQRPR
ncbi:MAG: hypothetical protein WKF84_21720 [Pyrinomonadaceae bacterium]